MNDEIEEFIRRAAERRKQQGGQRPPPKPKPAQAPPQTPPQQPSSSRPPLARPVARPPVVEAEVVSAELAEHVSSHVASHIDTREFSERASHFGEQTALADDRLEARLHRKFDHAIGRLTTSSIAQVEDIPDPGIRPAGETAVRPASPDILRQMLQSPQHVRNAIIMSEIFRRPEWDDL
jgi:hypothetical protein